MQFYTMSRILITAIVCFGLPNVLNAQLFPDVANDFLDSGIVNGAICSAINLFGNAFSGPIQGLLDSQIEGTENDVPAPYDKLIVLGVEEPEFEGCNATLVVNLRLTNIDPTTIVPDSDGFARIKGQYEPGLTFWEQEDSIIPGVRACGVGTYVDEIDMENEPAIAEGWLTDYINSQLDDPECAYIIGEDPDAEEEEDESESEDGGGGVIPVSFP